MDELLNDRGLIFVTGKGGVGKSVCAGAIASSLAATGARVLLVETDTFPAQPHIFGLPNPSEPAGQADGRIRLRERLDTVNLRASECLVQTLKRFLPSEKLVRAIAQNRITSAFFQSAPSVNEFVLLDQIEAQLSRSYDHVVVDLPATGHALTFLAVPKTLRGMMREKGPIAKRAGELESRIADSESTAIVAVCLPEELPVQETIEFASALENSLGRSLTCVLVNMIHDPPLENPSDLSAFRAVCARVLGGDDVTEALADEGNRGWRRLVMGGALSESWERRDRHYLRLLADEIDTPVVDIPMFFEVEDAKLVGLIEGVVRPAQAADTKREIS
jgi:arsenite/tail-anchored protein-transporting ATPase